MQNTNNDFDVIVIGAGPGGYVAAIRAAQLGLRVALVEKRPALGGTCLHIGCIPSKALLESSELFAVARDHFKQHGITTGELRLDLPVMMERKNRIVKELADGLTFLMRKNAIQVFRGAGRVVAPGRVRVETDEAVEDLAARFILLATGSESVSLPFLPEDGRRIVNSTQALAFDRVPDRLVVIGAGAIGLELGSVWRRLGAEVTVLEMLDGITPFADGQAALALERALRRQGFLFHFGARVTGAELLDDGARITYQSASGTTESIEGDRVLVAVGRRPYVEGLGLESLGVARDARGAVQVTARFETSVAGVYAIGDLVAGPMLAHKAEEEGLAVAEGWAGKPVVLNHNVIPNVVYTDPELAQVGLTEEEAHRRGLDVRVGTANVKANARAKTLGAAEGLVKIVAEARTDRILGVHAVGPRASEWIAEAAVAMEFGAASEDLARTTHPHPTLSELVREAAMAVEHRAIHS
jgi:dihydrolipoamide dehydrogenase